MSGHAALTRVFLVAVLLVASTARADEPRPIDWSPLIVASAGQIGGDVLSTHRFLRNGSGCVEGNALYGPHPSTAQLIGAKAIPLAATAALVVLAAQPHAPRWVKWTAKAVGYGGGAVGTISAMRNVRLCGL